MYGYFLKYAHLVNAEIVESADNTHKPTRHNLCEFKERDIAECAITTIIPRTVVESKSEYFQKININGIFKIEIE